eukprot:m.280386 g.280386  ORF g.280386 m.280386 type:complete len:516 (-) comp19399_c4_seq3:152-1699(-)
MVEWTLSADGDCAPPAAAAAASSSSSSSFACSDVKLSDLPLLAVDLILEWLDAEDVCRLGGVCRALRNTVNLAARDRLRVLAGPLYPHIKQNTMRHSWIAEYSLMQRQFARATIAAGAYQSLFARLDCVYAFGAGNLGQTAIPERVDRHTPHVAHSGGETVVCTSAGSAHSAFVLANGRCFVFGDGRYHQLGVGDIGVHVQPVALDLGNHQIHSVSCGACHTLFLTNKGRVLLCGNFHTEIHRTPQIVHHPRLDTVRVRQVSAGLVHSAILTEEGDVFTWGNNAHGQLGHASTSDAEQPTHVTALDSQKVVALSAGSLHTACICLSGDVYTWGCGARGRLGHGTEISQHTPTRVDALLGKRIASVVAGDELTVLLTELGDVYLTGTCPTSQSDVVVPFCVFPRRLQLPQGSGRCTGVALGAAHMLVSTTFGVLSLGRNSRGQAGQAAPAVINALTSVSQLFDLDATKQDSVRRKQLALLQQARKQQQQQQQWQQEQLAVRCQQSPRQLDVHVSWV